MGSTKPAAVAEHGDGTVFVVGRYSVEVEVGLRGGGLLTTGVFELVEDGTLVLVVLADSETGLAVLGEEQDELCRDLGVRFRDPLLHVCRG